MHVEERGACYHCWGAEGYRMVFLLVLEDQAKKNWMGFGNAKVAGLPTTYTARSYP